MLVPLAAGVSAAVLVSRTLPRPDWPGVIAWWLLLLLISGVVSMLVDRLARRLLPLAVLLRLTLIFPDQAPSRFALARQVGSVRKLQERVEHAREHGVEDDPARAAETILTMVAALSAHDRHTRGHSERVRAYTDLLAASMKLPEHDRDRLRWAALLHDIGKLEVEARILNKPGKPLPHEWDSLKRHPEEGARLAAPLLPWLGTWGLAIEQHHERFDGRGYPRGLAGAEISLGGRILTVTDSFETMTAARSYKKPMSVVAARQELANCAGSQFDPVVVRAFLNVSLGRLWWKVGPMSWLAQLPFIRLIGAPVVTGARTLSGAATKAAVGVVALGVGGTLHPAYGMQQPLSVSGTVGSIASAAHQSKADQAAGPSADSSQVGTDEALGDEGEAQDGSDAGGGNGDGASSDEGSEDGGGDPVGEAVENVKDRVDEASGAVDGVGDVAGGIGGAAQGADDAVDGATDAVNDAVNGAQDAVDGLLGG